MIQLAKEKGNEFIEEAASGEKEVELSISGSLDFIGSPEVLRTSAKIAYTRLAMKMGCAFAMRNLFDHIRQYVRTGTGEVYAKLFFNEQFLTSSNQGSHQHSIVIAGRRDRCRVDAIIRLFGGLSYFVNLTNGYEGADFYDTLAYNAQEGREDKVFFQNHETEFL